MDDITAQLSSRKRSGKGRNLFLPDRQDQIAASLCPRRIDPCQSMVQVNFRSAS